MGALNNLIPFTLIYWGQTQIDSGLASIFNAAAPVFTVLLAHYLTTDEKMTWSKGGGVAAGFGGVAFLIGPEALSRFGRANAQPIGHRCGKDVISVCRYLWKTHGAL